MRQDLPPSNGHHPQAADRYDLVVIGAGPAGLGAATAATALGARVALIERNVPGGTCLNTGCVPSKAIIRTSRLYAEMHDAERYGAQIPAEIRVDFPAVMQRMRRIRARTVNSSCNPSMLRITSSLKGWLKFSSSLGVPWKTIFRS